MYFTNWMHYTLDIYGMLNKVENGKGLAFKEITDNLIMMWNRLRQIDICLN